MQSGIAIILFTSWRRSRRNTLSELLHQHSEERKKVFEKISLSRREENGRKIIKIDNK